MSLRLVAAALALLPGVALSNGAVVQTVELGATEVSAMVSTDSAQGDQYSLDLAVPGGVTLTNFVGAYLEFQADVSSAEVNGWVNDMPVVEVYLLLRNSVTYAESGDLVKPSAMRRNVSIASNQRVRIDVSQAVRYVLANPHDNYGLVIGSFRGEREARISLKTLPGTNAKALITYYSRE